jgi:hypothetical protein
LTVAHTDYPIVDPDALRAIALEVVDLYSATDDRPRAAVKTMEAYAPLYAAAIAYMAASLETERYPVRARPLEQRAKFALAVAQGRVRSCFAPLDPEQPDEPHWLAEE